MIGTAARAANSLINHRPVLVPSLLVVGCAVLAACFVLAQLVTDEALRASLDNIHWTTTHLIAAFVAWLTWRSQPDQSANARRYFAIGLSLYAIGQLAWDLQSGFGWTPFPAPSDIFYALLGPCVALGFWQTLHAHSTATRRRMLAIDISILLIQVLALLAVFYLDQLPAVTPLQLLSLMIYPLALLSPVVLGGLVVMELNLRLNRAWWLWLVGLTLFAIMWMQWNWLDLTSTPRAGTLLNASFSTASLMVGAAAGYWQWPEPVAGHALRRSTTLVRAFIPVVPVIIAVATLLWVLGANELPRAVRWLVVLGDAAIIVLSVVRQSVGIAEREQLLATERLMTEKDAQYRATARRLELATAAARLGIWEINLSRQLAVWDSTMYRLYGYDPGCKLDPFLIWENAALSDEREKLRTAIFSAAQRGEEIYREFVIVLPDGELRHLETFFRPQRQSDSADMCLIGVTRDITDRVMARRALAESEAELRAIFDNAMIGVVLIDEQRNIIRHNQAVRDLLGYDFKTAFSLHGDDVLHPEEQARSHQQLAELARGQRQSYVDERRYRCASGQYRWVRVSVYPVKLHNVQHFVLLIEDIESRKQAELALTEAQSAERRLRDEFTYHLLQVQEQERQRIANELHDSLGQSLSVIKNRAQLVAEQVDPDSSAAQQLQGILRITVDAINETRRLAHNLRPLHIEQLGLTAALQQLLDQFGEASKMQIESRLENIDSAFAGGQVTHIFRLVQECLNNIGKHAHASHVQVSAEHDLHEVRLVIRDNGVGFVSGNQSQRGLGLTSMSERAQMLGGHVAVTSIPGVGTQVSITLPIASGEVEHGTPTTEDAVAATRD